MYNAYTQYSKTIIKGNNIVSVTKMRDPPPAHHHRFPAFWAFLSSILHFFCKNLNEIEKFFVTLWRKIRTITFMRKRECIKIEKKNIL